MKIFISWSGESSKAIALELSEWLSLILSDTQPFISITDIAAGARWLEVVGKNLGDISYGLICLTPDNLKAPWLLFEAGAISKNLDSKVATLLFGLEPSQIDYPLKQFQATQFDTTGFRKLVGEINGKAEEHLKKSDKQLDKLFEMTWPDVKKKIELMLKQYNEGTKVIEASELTKEDRILQIVSEMQGFLTTMNYRFQSQEALLHSVMAGGGGDVGRFVAVPTGQEPHYSDFTAQLLQLMQNIFDATKRSRLKLEETNKLIPKEEGKKKK